MGKIEDLLKGCTVKVNNGSGCLFQPAAEYTYVLTAKHNIEPENEDGATTKLEITDIDVWGNKLNIEDRMVVEKIYPHENMDLAILMVEKITPEVNLFYSNCKMGDKVIFCGYPERLTDEDDGIGFVRCTVNYEDDYWIEITPDQPQFASDHNAYENNLGFSGCGVFKCDDDIMLLLGILVRMSDSSGAGGNIKVRPIKYFDTVAKPPLAPLIPNYLYSFEGYISKITAKYDYDEDIKHIVSNLEKAAKCVIKKEVTPVLVREHFMEKLCIPLRESWTSDSDLWEGWLEFIVYCLLVRKRKSRLKKLNFVLDLLKNKLFFYNRNEERWPVICRMILDLDIAELKDGCTIITHQKKLDSLNETKLNTEKVVKRIDRVQYQLEKYRLLARNKQLETYKIDEGRKPFKDLTFINLSEFRNKIFGSRNRIRESNGDVNKIVQVLRNSIEKALE